MADRSFPEQRPHEARFRPMSPAAKLSWYTLTATLGASGIAIAYPATVAELTGYSYPEIEAALSELEERGWLRRDGAVMWMVAGLLEQGLNPRNANHRASVQAHLGALEPIAPDLVAAYRVHHAGWLHLQDADGTGDAPPPKDQPACTPSAGRRHTVRDSIPMVAEAKEGGRVGGEGGKEAGDRDPGKRSGAVGGESAHGADPAPAPPAAAHGDESAGYGDGALAGGQRDPDFAPLRAAPLAQLVRRLMRERYGGAADDRRRDVACQLVAALSPEGVRVKRGQVVRTTPSVLARALELALSEPIRDPDRTIVVVLLKCGEGAANLALDARGRTPTDAAAEDGAAERAEAERQTARELEEAAAWLAEHPDEAAEIARRVDLELPDRPGLALTRQVRVAQLAAELRAELAEAAA